MASSGSREALLAVPLPTESVEIEDVGTYTVRGLTGTQRDRYEQSVVQMRGGNVLPKFEGARARLIQMTVLDPDGDGLMFTDRDLKVIGTVPARVLQQLYDAAAHLSGLRKEDVEELVGNSDGVQSESGTSDSPSLSDAPSTNSFAPSAASS